MDDRNTHESQAELPEISKIEQPMPPRHEWLSWSRSHGEETHQDISPPALAELSNLQIQHIKGLPDSQVQKNQQTKPGSRARDESAWDRLCGQAGFEGDLQEFLIELESKPDFRSGVMLQALSRLRDVLKSESEQAPLETMVPLLMRDAIVIARALLERLR